MPGTGTYHHCPGEENRVGSIPPGGCDPVYRPKPPEPKCKQCLTHQDYCYKHHWSYRKDESCTRCDFKRDIEERKRKAEEELRKQKEAEQKEKNDWNNYSSEPRKRKKKKKQASHSLV